MFAKRGQAFNSIRLGELQCYHITFGGAAIATCRRYSPPCAIFIECLVFESADGIGSGACMPLQRSGLSR